MLTMSPSSILAHMKCPLQAWAQRTHLIKWQDSPAKARGTEAHARLEEAVKNKFFMDKIVFPDGVNTAYLATTLQKLHDIALADNLTVYTEQDVAVTKNFKPTEFMSPDAFLRCRADLLMMGKSYIYIGDWKTGKIYDYSVNQMKIEAFICATRYNIPVVHWSLFYIDQGETKTGVVNLSYGLKPIADLLKVMQEFQKLHQSNGPWLAKKNPFCKWCELYHSDNCKESAQW